MPVYTSANEDERNASDLGRALFDRGAVANRAAKVWCPIEWRNTKKVFNSSHLTQGFAKEGIDSKNV